MGNRKKRQRGNPEQKEKDENAKHMKRTKNPSHLGIDSDGKTKQKSILASLSSEEKCNLVAELGELVLEDPSKAFKMEKESKYEGDGSGTARSNSKVQQLLDLSRTNKNGNNEYIATLGVMSLLAIFKDIIPSYRIRQQTDIERESKISKETKALCSATRRQKPPPPPRPLLPPLSSPGRTAAVEENTKRSPKGTFKTQVPLTSEGFLPYGEAAADGNSKNKMSSSAGAT